ncbi:DUF3987 domain-containing protein [Sphingomonas paucimobilis]|uniref:YfjI family protein n=1 Tax=Sphingomonas paucimobilis TaxID=13689 RepID=UPI000DE35FB4|nr:YfjI family protein [Sphingomonas paucimobilis]QBE91919.1 DUF3987 domain-containing protein [Sphingomonas paucimobilis]
MSGVFDRSYGDADPVVPQPLDIKASTGEAEPFPILALSDRLRKAILAIEAMAQVPQSLAAQSVLAGAALAAQGFIDVETIIGQGKPVSLFFVTIAASGDRKSTSDGFAIKPVKEREELLAQRYELARHDYAIDDAAFKAATTKAKSGKANREEIRSNLEAIGKPPVPPAQPLLTVDEPTGPGMQRLFAEANPALGLFSDEGATFLGGWGMQDDNQAATGGMLSKLWDGSPIKRIRADKENGTTILYRRRLSAHLMIQPNLAGKLLGNHAMREQGLLSRMLVAAPKSLKGTRFWKEVADEHHADLAAYHERLGRILTQEFAYQNIETRLLDLKLVRLQPEAKAALVAFSDHCERHLGPGGKYEHIADFASKMTENATRLAAVIAFFEGGSSVIRDGLSVQAAKAGIALAEFYASEAARLYGAGAVDDDTANAVTLIDWIRKNELPVVGVRFLNRKGPSQVRAANALKRAIEMLVDHNHLKKLTGPHVIEWRGKSETNQECYMVIPLEQAE